MKSSVICLSGGGPKGVHVERQPLYPANDQQRTVFNVVIGVMVRDENRFECAKWNPGAGILVGNSHPAIKHIGYAVAQHHVRRHFA
jgi:hypothetical protein